MSKSKSKNKAKTKPANEEKLRSDSKSKTEGKPEAKDRSDPGASEKVSPAGKDPVKKQESDSPNGNMPPKHQMPKIDGTTVKRLLSYIFSNYKGRFFLVLVCILISSVVNVIGSMFLKVLIDSYIMPLVEQVSPDFTELTKALITMACIYACGISAAYLYQRLMITISQGILKRVRDDMFEHMQTLPIGYFDTHTHGDIMSYYTNDTDTLRQMISQSIPQVFNSVITIIAVFCGMLYTSWYLTIVVLLFVIVQMFVVKTVGGRSGKYFIGQQHSLGKVNGYIEEMITGQKVVKVFCHEKAAKEDFDKLNEELYESAYNANQFANMLMPIMMNIGNLQYVVVAIVGAVLALSGKGGVITVGAIVSFLQLSKSFSAPIGQVSQQFNSIVMALAGAQRIFSLMDEKSEVDDGYVTLVNAKREGENRSVGMETSPRRRNYNLHGA